jgi:PEP-CTERM motif
VRATPDSLELTMTFTPTFTPKPLLRRTAVAAALVALCASASALPAFTFNPAGAALSGTAFTADNMLISDYATVRFGPGNTFTETGFLSISGAQLGGVTLVPPGLNSTYGMYIKFTGTGNTGAGDPGLVGTSGTFTTLTYTLFGYNGTASFGFDAGNNPTETAAGEVTLATGSLVNGTVSTSPAGGGDFTPSAAARLTFATAAGAAPFFVAPVPFYNVALSSFTNTVSQVTRFDGGFKISQGGGSFNFVAAPIPEPETYALMLGGLFAVGFMARRRKA